MNPSIEYKRNKEYTTTTTNHVGPCSDISIRSGFDCGVLSTTFNNGNSCFVSSTTGSSSNQGTFGAPMSTIQEGISKCVTFGYSNCLVLDSSTYEEVLSDIPANLQILAANGCTPRLKWKINTFESTLDLDIGKVFEMSDGSIVGFADYKVIRSIDIGCSWTDISPPSVSSASDLVVTNTGRIVLASSVGIWYSDNYGSSWTQSLSSEPIYTIAVCKSGNLLAFGNLSTGNIHKSENNGSTWTAIFHNYPTSHLPFLKCVTSTGRILCSSGVNTVFSSDDEGSTWSMNKDIQTATSYWMDIAESHNGFLMLCVNSVSATSVRDIYISKNNGDTWELLQRPTSIPKNVQMRFSLSCVHNRFFLSIGDISSFLEGTLVYSDDFGSNWHMLNEGINYHRNQMCYSSSQKIAFQKYFYSSYTANKIRYHDLKLVPQTNNTLTIDGFYLDGNNKQALGILSGTGSQTNLTLKYCDLDNYYYSAIQDIDGSNFTMQYCRVNGGKYGIICD